MIRRAALVRFDRKTEIGRTEPLRVMVVTDDQAEHEVVMKAAPGPGLTIESLANELLGSILAADLGLPVKEPFLVQIDMEFVETVALPEQRRRLGAACALAFASLDAGRQWRGWNASDKVGVQRLSAAVAVFAFDAFTANSDRRPANPNLLVNGLDWCLIDHEAAFSFRMKVFPRCEPWKMGNLGMMTANGTDSEHVFAQHLEGQRGLDFAEVERRWSDLSDARLAQYDAMLPEEWNEARPAFEEALHHLKQVRDSIGACIAELKRVLS